MLIIIHEVETLKPKLQRTSDYTIDSDLFQDLLNNFLTKDFSSGEK